MKIKALLSTLILINAWPNTAVFAEEFDYNPLNPYAGKNAFTEERQVQYEAISNKRGEFRSYNKLCKSIDALERPWESIDTGLSRIDLSKFVIRRAKITSKSRLDEFKDAEQAGEKVGKERLQSFQGNQEEKLEFCQERINEFREFSKQHASLMTIFLPQFRDEGDLILFPDTRYYELTEREYTTLEQAMSPYGEFLTYAKFCQNIEPLTPGVSSMKAGLPYMERTLFNVKHSKAIDKKAFANLKELRQQGQESAQGRLETIETSQQSTFCQTVVQNYSEFSQTYSPLLIQVNEKTSEVAIAAIAESKPCNCSHSPIFNPIF